MKITGYIFLILVLGGLSGCIYESFDTEENGTLRGVMQIDIIEQEGETEDKMQTIRFLVFTETNGLSELELNQYVTIPAVSGGKEASRLRILLEVSRKIDEPNNKTVIAIVNEPTELNSTLDEISDYTELEEIKLSFAGFLNINHTALADGKGLPMTGILQTSKVYATEAEATHDPAIMSLERAVARVDVYLRKGEGSTLDLKAGSTVALDNTYHKSYLLRHTTGQGVFGQIQTVTTSDLFSQLFEQETTQTVPEASDGEDGLLICSFYTPERTCKADNDADKLVVKFDLLSNDGDHRTGKITLDNMESQDGEVKPIETIERNNCYRIIATAGGDNSFQVKFTIRYMEWEQTGQSIIFD